MKDEIKEILDRLERIDHKEYSGGFEFTDSGSFDEMARCFEERKKLANYITNLQEENEELKKNQRYHKKFGNDYIFCLEGDKETYKDYIFELQERIEKAIEYIKQYREVYYPDEPLSKPIILYGLGRYEEDFNEEKLLNILQGVGKDEN